MLVKGVVMPYYLVQHMLTKPYFTVYNIAIHLKIKYGNVPI